MKRLSVNSLTVVSLLALAGATGMWVRSHWVSDEYTWAHDPDDPTVFRATQFSSMPGALVLGRLRVQYLSSNGVALARRAREFMGGRKTRPAPSLPRWAVSVPFAMSDSRNESARRFDNWFVQVPYWMIVVSAAVVPVSRLHRRWRRRRRAPGVCARCGYDLRATPGRCPECGTATVSVTQQRL